MITIPLKTNKQINQVITLSPSHSIFFDCLGLGDKIIAVSSYDNNINHRNKINISGGVNFDEEKVLELKPDLVVIGDIQKNSESVAFLESHGIKTLIVKTKSFQNIYQALVDIQNIFSNYTQSCSLSNFYHEWKQFEHQPVPNRRKAFIILAVDPVYSISTNNYLNELYYYSGWDNVIATKTEYPILSEEHLYSLTNIDDIIITVNITNELALISNIQQITKAKNIVIISNQQISLPAPHLPKIIKELRKLQSSLFN